MLAPLSSSLRLWSGIFALLFATTVIVLCQSASASVVSFGASGNGGGEDAVFDRLSAIDMDSSGNIYTFDILAGRIKMFVPNGDKTVWTFSRGLNVATTSTGNCQSGSFADGTVCTGNPLGSGPVSFSVAPDGSKFLLRDGTNRVQAFDWTGFRTGEITTLPGYYYAGYVSGAASVLPVEPVGAETGTYFVALSGSFGSSIVRCRLGGACGAEKTLRTDGNTTGPQLDQTSGIARAGSSILVLGRRYGTGGPQSGYILKYRASDLDWQAKLVEQLAGSEDFPWASGSAAVAGGVDGSFLGFGYGAARFGADGTRFGVFGDSQRYIPGGPSVNQCRQPVGPAAPWSAYVPGGSASYSDGAVGDDGTVVLADTTAGGAKLIVIAPRPIAWAKSLTRTATGATGVASPIVSTGETVGFSAQDSLTFGAKPTSFEWDFDNDGAVDATSTPANPVVEKAFATAGSKAVKVRIISPGQSPAEGTVSLSVAESFATITGGGIGGKDLPRAGQSVEYTAGGRVTCGQNEFSWDLDGDGSYETSGADRITKVFPKDGSHEIGVRIAHDGGRADVARATVSVRKAPRAAQGEPGVSINGGATYTNDPTVRLTIGWAADTDAVRVSNDGGFANAKLFEIASPLSWELETSGSERLPKTVYIRFGDTQYTDDIILDRTAPEVTSPSASASSTLRDADRASLAKKRSKGRTVNVRFKAKDNVSGVARFQATASTVKPGAWIRNSRAGGALINDSTYSLNTKLKGVKSGTKTVFVRVADSAGNESVWKKVRIRRR